MDGGGERMSEDELRARIALLERIVLALVNEEELAEADKKALEEIHGARSQGRGTA